MYIVHTDNLTKALTVDAFLFEIYASTIYSHRVAEFSYIFDIHKYCISGQTIIIYRSKTIQRFIL